MQEIAIRSIQHYMYCPHRWGLLEIDRAWAENVFVTKANLMHKRVHNRDNSYVSKGKKTFTSVPVYNDLQEYNLYGVTDCLELILDADGICIGESDGKYKICIVEYKPTKPKHVDFHEEDLIQVFAQKVCVDYVFGGDCEAVIYYADCKKRVHLPLSENYEEYNFRLKQLLREIRSHLDTGKIPPIRKGQKCSGCSLKDICMPSLRTVGNIQSAIEKIGKTGIY